MLIEDSVFTCGKHAYETIWQVARDDPSYLKWVLDEIDDLDQDVYGDLEEALKMVW